MCKPAPVPLRTKWKHLRAETQTQEVCQKKPKNSKHFNRPSQLHWQLCLPMKPCKHTSPFMVCMYSAPHLQQFCLQTIIHLPIPVLDISNWDLTFKKLSYSILWCFCQVATSHKYVLILPRFDSAILLLCRSEPAWKLRLKFCDVTIKFAWMNQSDESLLRSGEIRGKII